LFGVGLVKTTEDFGAQGEWPVNPALLDWLAVEMVEGGWDVKRFLKTVMMSATYQQSSDVRPEVLERDPENRLLARGPRFRLPAEAIRDQALALGGLLVEKLGGPSVKPYQPAGLWEESGAVKYVPSTGEGLYRRSLYTYWKRTIAPPTMSTFDATSREVCSVKEGRTNTPLQALALLNDATYVEAARRLGERIWVEGGQTEADRLRWAFRLVLTRAPGADELGVLRGHLADQRARYRRDPAAAEKLLKVGESPVRAGIPAHEAAAYTSLALLLLNLDETITKE
jgi:hypothetical protein